MGNEFDETGFLRGGRLINVMDKDKTVGFVFVAY